MFEEMEIADILDHFRFVKVPVPIRDFIDKSREQLQQNGSLPIDIQDRLRGLSKRYSKRFKEVSAARQRARRTNALKAMGMTREDLAERVAQRKKCEKKRRNDVGF